MTKGIALILLYTLVILTSGKQIEDKKSRLILEFDWPEPKKNLQRFPHAVSCSLFYALRPGVGQVLKKCPNDELFDYRTLRCRQETEAKCWSDLLKRGISKKKANYFKCPFPWGLYPNTEDCSLFYDCLNGVPYGRKCPDNFLFDNAERECVEAKEAMCADHKDIIEPGYKCPYKWGYFTHSKDCSKYYECLRKVPNLRTCKKNMLFDNFKRRCLPVGDVECGGRINPYGFDQVTPESKPKTTNHIVSHPIPDERMQTNIDTISADDKDDHLPRIYQDTANNHIFAKRKMTNEWKTNNLISTERPVEITNGFFTGRPRETTNRFSTGRPWETSNEFSTRHPWKTTNRYSTRRPWETTNRISTRRPWETTNRFSTGRPWETSNEFSTRHPRGTTNHQSTRRPWETTNRFSTGRPWETTNDFSTRYPRGTTNHQSTRRPWETTNRFSTGRPWETTNRFSTGRPWETSNEISSRHPRGTTNYQSRRLWETTNRFPTGRPWETKIHFSTEHPGLKIDHNPSGSGSASTNHIPSGGQSEAINRFSTARPALITENFPTSSPEKKADRNSSEPAKIVSDIPSSKLE